MQRKSDYSASTFENYWLVLGNNKNATMVIIMIYPTVITIIQDKKFVTVTISLQAPEGGLISPHCFNEALSCKTLGVLASYPT